MRSSSSTAEASCSCCSTSLDRARRSIGFALADGLIAPARVDYRAIGFHSSDFPTREEVAAYYAEKTERDLSSISYYVALAHFKLACIVEAKVARASIGQDPPAFGEQFL